MSSKATPVMYFKATDLGDGQLSMAVQIIVQRKLVVLVLRVVAIGGLSLLTALNIPGIASLLQKLVQSWM